MPNIHPAQPRLRNDTTQHDQRHPNATLKYLGYFFTLASATFFGVYYLRSSDPTRVHCYPERHDFRADTVDRLKKNYQHGDTVLFESVDSEEGCPLPCKKFKEGKYKFKFNGPIEGWDSRSLSQTMHKLFTKQEKILDEMQATLTQKQIAQVQLGTPVVWEADQAQIFSNLCEKSEKIHTKILERGKKRDIHLQKNIKRFKKTSKNLHVIYGAAHNPGDTCTEIHKFGKKATEATRKHVAMLKQTQLLCISAKAKRRLP